MSETLDLFNNLLLLAVDNGASDIHVKTGKPALLRINGHLEPVDMDQLSVNQVLAFVEDSCPVQFFERWQTDNQVDYSYRLDEVGRFRVNAFYQRGTPSMVFRHVKDRPPTFSELNLDSSLFVDLCGHSNGIMLVCGPTGCGKSSTLAAMLNWININADKHIVTLEDPIEFTYSDIKSSFDQREIGIDAPTFELGITSVLRQDPDIIMIGEMRDAETFNTALTAAETGHYVFGTLHSSSAQQSVQRLFDYYPPDQHIGLRRQISSTLRAIVTQRLVSSLDGSSRLPVIECLVMDALARTVISEGSFEKIPAVVEAGKDSGSRSFNQDLYRLVKEGKISKKTGLGISPNPKALEMNLKGIFLSEGGIVG